MVHGIVYNEDTWGSSWAYVLVNRNLHFPYSCFAKWESLRDVDTYSRYWYIAHGYVSDITSDCVLIAGHIYLQFYQHFTVILSTEKTLNFTRCLFGCGPRYDKQIFGKDGMCLASCTIKSVYLTWLAKTHRPYFLMLLTWKLEHGADGQRTLVAWGAYIIILMKYCVYNRKYVVHGVQRNSRQIPIVPFVINKQYLQTVVNPPVPLGPSTRTIHTIVVITTPSNQEQ